MCNIGEWRYEQGLEQGEEKMIFAYLDHSIEPEMTVDAIVSLLCESFGFSHKDAQRYYDKYRTLSR